ncbi:MAG TPA: PRC-barrel domain-containing protein [Verrucomicrobiae bacterium]|nr:PRC-barrel domain-containing protein [Verrucomicrobiae bacterium]
MKARPIMFLGMTTAVLCLATPNCLRAHEVAGQPDTANPPHQSIPSDANNQGAAGNGLSGQSSGNTFTPNQNQAPAPVNRASNLIGMRVRNQNNQTVGKIKDIVFDLQSGRVAYVVLEKAGRAHGTGSNIAVPLSAFTPSSDNRQLILNADKNQVQNTRGFSGGNYPPMGNSVYGAQPAAETQHIIIVPVPMSPDQDHDNLSSPDQNHHQDASPDSDTDHTY